MLNLKVFSLSGARASFELKELEETITWCEKGLDVSFSLFNF